MTPGSSHKSASGRLADPVLWQRLLVGFSLLALALQIVLVARGWTFYQYDFRAYYSGPYLYSIGEDPYSVEAHLAWASSEGLHDHPLAFVYSPLLLRLFSPLALLPYPVAFGVWLALQVIALTYICVATVRALGVPAHWAVPCIAFGLNGTCAAVLRSGQVTLIMLALLLASVALLKRNRTQAALLASGMAATLKIWILSLLLIAMVPFSKRRVLLLILAICAVVGLTLSGTLFAPDLQSRYQDIIGGMVQFDRTPGSPYNQSILNILSYFAEAGAFSASSLGAVYVTFSLVAVLLTATVCVPLALANIPPSRLYPLMFSIACLLLLMIVPRAVHYQWTIALPAASFVLFNIRSGVPKVVLLCMFMIPPLYINRYVFGISTDDRLESLVLLPWGFWSYLNVLLLWIAALGIARRERVAAP